MALRETSSNAIEDHFVDIHQVHPEEKEQDQEIIRIADKVEKRSNRPIKHREMRKPQRSFSRQVSLETGFAALSNESKAKDDRRVLARSGRSFGGFTSAARAGGEGRKGDFSIFRTKSTINKQHSMLPLREGEMDFQRTDVSGGLDESVNKSVPAGRYFAALRGPELDQVKVIIWC